MSEQPYNIDRDLELSPAETAEIDRILSETAALDDAGVDYGAILKGVKAKAKAEGIVIFPSAKAKKRRDLAKRLALGAATAAAVFVVGLSALFVLRQLGDDEYINGQVDALASEKADDKTASNVTHVKTTLAPRSESNATEEPDKRGESGDPMNHIADTAEATEEPDRPLPTEFATKGGSAGYVDLDKFREDPAAPDDLVPVELPSCMNVIRAEDPVFGPREISVEASGEADGKEYSYSCKVVHDLDVDVEVGIAMYKFDEESGHITYIWRISEDSFLVADFDGFDKEAADELLQSLVGEAQAEETPAA